MKVILAGGRNITDYKALLSAIKDSGFSITEVVSGGALGVDYMGEWYSESVLGKEATIFEALWDLHGRYNAGWIRNGKMGNYADALVALWDGESTGTKHMIDFMKAINKPIHVRILKC